MRRALVALMIAASVPGLFAGCTGTATVDPYAVTTRAFQAGWDQVQVSVGMSVTAAGQTIAIPPAAMRLVVDGVAGKALVTVSIPASTLGVPGAFARLGLSGDSLTFDAVYDGEALYARSAVMGPALRQLFAGSSALPSGDLTGWLRLVQRSDLEKLGAGSAGPALPAIPAPPSGSTPPSPDGAPLRQTLDSVGIGLSYAGEEQRDALDTDHVHGTVDWNKLVNSPAASSVPQTEVDQLRAMAASMSTTFDLWADRATGRLDHVDVHFAVRGSNGGSFDVEIGLAAPPAGLKFGAPPKFLDVPLLKLLGPFMTRSFATS